MRRDMPKVLVERPRKGGKGSRVRRYRADDNHPLREGIKTRWTQRKELNENLRPLVRFLRSRCGRPWNKVYSEIREYLNPNSAVQMHILQHLFQYVYVNVRMIDNVPHSCEYTAGWKPIYCWGGRSNYFYVHPETCLLLMAPHYNPWEKREDEVITKIFIGEQEYRLLNGNWFWISKEYGDYLRLLEGPEWYRLNVDERYRLELKEAKFHKVRHKRQIGGKELKMVRAMANKETRSRR